MLINEIENNVDKIYEQDEFGKFVIKQRDVLFDAAKVILEFNETIQSDLT